MLRRRTILWLLLGAVVISSAGISASFYRSVYALPISDTGFSFDLPEKQSFAGLTQELVRKEIIKSPVLWTLFARVKGADRQIKAGNYQVEAGTSLNQLLQMLVEGRTSHHQFTIHEGWELRRIIDSMRGHPQIVMTVDTPEAIRAHLKIPQGSAEGWIYPDTYFFEKGTSNAKLLETAHALMKKKLGALWESRASDLPFSSPYEALILASIVEKETANDEEYRRIAGVFVSRLEKRMRLQSDPSVIYGLGEKFDGNLRRSDLVADTVYNTYVHHGLPPTPISMPGEKSIAAVMNPERREELYFVSKGNGTHHFSRTYAEHQTAVRRYQLKR